MKSKRKILYLDMDGVLVDFASGIRKTPLDVIEQYKDRPDEIPGIFARMDPMPGAIEAVEALSKQYNVYVLSTAPWGNPSAWADKVAFIQKYFPDVLYKRLILTHNKALCKGDYLVDDRPNHGADRFRGEWIAFGSDRFPDWKAVLDYLDTGRDLDEEEYEEELDRVVKAFIKKVKEQLSSLVPDDYPSSWNALDWLSYEWSCKGYSICEIMPGLERTLFDIIDGCCDGTAVYNLNDVYNAFIEYLDHRSDLKKIQDYYYVNG